MNLKNALTRKKQEIKAVYFNCYQNSSIFIQNTSKILYQICLYFKIEIWRRESREDF